MISFTGGVRVGKEIANKKHMIPLVLELGGNDAGYVRKDANIENAVNEVAKGAFSYSGQRCTAIKRLILDKDISEEFLNKLTIKVKEMVFGPLVSKGASNYVSELIQDSENNNETFILKGKKQNNNIEPHIVLTNKESRAWKEEAFGPLLPVIVIDNDDNLLELFNDTEFGLQNSIFTSDVKWAKEFAINIESGTININRSSSRGPDVFPFSGVKNSGFGVQGIKHALLSMTRILNIVEND